MTDHTDTDAQPQWVLDARAAHEAWLIEVAERLADDHRHPAPIIADPDLVAHAIEVANARRVALRTEYRLEATAALYWLDTALGFAALSLEYHDGTDAAVTAFFDRVLELDDLGERALFYFATAHARFAVVHHRSDGTVWLAPVAEGEWGMAELDSAVRLDVPNLAHAIAEIWGR